MGVRDPWRYPEFLCECNGLKCKSNSYVARDEKHADMVITQT